MAAADDTFDQFADKTVFGAPQRLQIQPGRLQEGLGVDAPAMRGIEQQRPAVLRRLDDFERGSNSFSVSDIAPG
jgi:hypothetical protein